jgi:hypothetical protein
LYAHPFWDPKTREKLNLEATPHNSANHQWKGHGQHVKLPPKAHLGTVIMLEQILGIFSDGRTITAAIAAIIMVLIKAIDFHDKHFVLKRHKRLQELRSSVTTKGPLTEYLDESIRLEAFRIASGVRASTLKAAALIKLSSLGFWDREQIRKVAKFLAVTPMHPIPVIHIHRSDKLEAWVGLALAIFSLVIGAIFCVALTTKYPPYGPLVGLALFTALILSSALLSSDYRNLKNAQQFKKYLEAHPNVLLNQEQVKKDLSEPTSSIDS